MSINIVVLHSAGYSPALERTLVNPATHALVYDYRVRDRLFPSGWRTAPFTRDGLASIIQYARVFETEEEARAHPEALLPVRPGVLDLSSEEP